MHLITVSDWEMMRIKWKDMCTCAHAHTCAHPTSLFRVSNRNVFLYHRYVSTSVTQKWRTLRTWRHNIMFVSVRLVRCNHGAKRGPWKYVEVWESFLLRCSSICWHSAVGMASEKIFVPKNLAWDWYWSSIYEGWLRGRGDFFFWILLLLDGPSLHSFSLMLEIRSGTV